MSYGKSLIIYLKEISTSIPLSNEQEIELSRRVKAGDKLAEQELIEANTRFVVSIANQYRNRGLSIEDLISAGNEGLVTAAKRFDEQKGVRFITYAVWWIRQVILRDLNNFRVVSLPVNRLKDMARLWKVENVLIGQGRDPDDEELAVEMGWLKSAVTETRQLSQFEFSLDELPLHISDSSIGPDELLSLGETYSIIVESINLLDSRSQKIVNFYFGFEYLDAPISKRGKKKAPTYKQIGDYLGLTKQRVRQIMEEALLDLRRILRQRGIDKSHLA